MKQKQGQMLDPYFTEGKGKKNLQLVVSASVNVSKLETDIHE